MEILFLITVFVLGALIGSFLNCLVLRKEQGKSFVVGRSFCPSCKKTLLNRDLFPVISFLWLKGKCRFCSQKISFQYPAVEILTGIVFAVIFIFQKENLPTFFGQLETIYLLLVFSLIVAIFIYDLRNYIIPDEWTFSLIGLVSLWHISSFFIGEITLTELIYFGVAGLMVFLFFLSIYVLSKGEWIGFGDVKLVFFMGIFLGVSKVLVALFSAFVSGAIIGITLILLNKKKIKSEVPFAPFLLLGAFIGFFWGTEILNWYLGFFELNAVL